MSFRSPLVWLVMALCVVGLVGLAVLIKHIGGRP